MKRTDALVNVEEVTRRFALDHSAVTALDCLTLAIDRGEIAVSQSKARACVFSAQRHSLLEHQERHRQ